MGTYYVLAACMLLYVFVTRNLMQNYQNADVKADHLVPYIC